MGKFWDTIKGWHAWLRNFLHTEVWRLDFQSLSKVQKRLVRDVRVVLDTIDNVNEKNLGMLSASLCYFCAMAVVPMVALFFSVTGGLGLDQLLRDILESNFGGDQPFVVWVLGAADNIVAVTRTGLFGVISALTFLWIVIWMMDRVEKVFNIPWGVRQPKKKRKFWTSYSIDLAILLLTPFIIILFFAGSIVYSDILDFLIPNSVFFSESVKSFIGWLVFCAIAVLIISIMYKYIPTAKVKYKCALEAAMISGVAFTLLQYIYVETQGMFNRINAIYGTIAAIPLFLLWLRFAWMIIVMGVQVSYAFQHQEEELSTISSVGKADDEGGRDDDSAPENDNEVA